MYSSASLLPSAGATPSRRPCGDRARRPTLHRGDGGVHPARHGAVLPRGYRSRRGGRPAVCRPPSRPALPGGMPPGTVGLAPHATGRFPGTRWRVHDAGGGAVTLECLGAQAGPRVLRGHPYTGTVAVAPTTDRDAQGRTGRRPRSRLCATRSGAWTPSTSCGSWMGGPMTARWG